MVNGAPPLVEVRILGLPIDVYQETAEHTDELRREFALIRERDGEEGAHRVPSRLLELIERLGQQFQAFTGPQEVQLQEAVAQGDTSIDLFYRVPAEARQACIDLRDMLDEADEFCRDGQELLTLAAPPRTVAFRNWFLDQFVDQIDGGPPAPWKDPSN